MRTLSPIVLALVCSPAFGADLVIYSGDATAARAAAEAALGSDIELKAIDDLTAGKPVLVTTTGTISTCTGTPGSFAAADAQLTAAEALVNDLDLGPALLDALTKADVALWCSTDAVDFKKAGRIEYLYGVALHFAEKQDQARGAFTSALAFEPTIAWDDQFPPSARGRFDEAKALHDGATVTQVALAPRSAQIKVDGVAPTVTNGKAGLSEGVHVVQYDGHIYRLELPHGAAPTVFVVGAFHGEALADAAKTTGEGADLARFLAWAAPARKYAVVSGTHVYSASGDTWTDVTPEEKEGGGFKPGMALIPVGGAVFVGGGVLAITGMSAAGQAVDDASVSGITAADYTAAQDRWKGAKGRVIAGDLLMLAGAGLAAGGIYMGTLDAAPMVLPGGGGLVVGGKL